MKVKHLLTLAGLAAMGGSSAWAQNDVTSTYIVNPGFELQGEDTPSAPAALAKTGADYYGWHLPNLGESFSNVSIGNSDACDGNGYGIPSAASEGSFYFFNRKGWGTQAGEISQTTKLPAGKYFITVDYKAYERTTTNGTIGFKVNDESILTTKPFYAAGNNSGTWAQTDPWKTVGAWFTVEEEGDVKIAITENLVGNSARADLYLDNVKLYKWDLDDEKNFDNASKNNPFDVTAKYVKNPYFDDNVNDWTSTTGYQNKGRATNQGGSLSGGFWENWNPSAKDSGKMSQQLTGLKDGIYRLTATVFNNKADGKLSLFIGGSKKTTIVGNTNTTYSVEGAVSGGSTEIGIVLEEGNAAEWIGLDNVKLEYIGYDINSAITATKESAATAKELLDSKFDKELKEALEEAIKNIEDIDAETATKESVKNLADALTTATDEANTSIEEYAAQKALVEKYTNTFGITIANIAEFNEAYENGTLTEDLNADKLYHSALAAQVSNIDETLTADIELKWSEEPAASGQHWDGTGTSKYYDTWSGSATTKTYTASVKLPAGTYAIKATGRGQVGTTTFMTAGEKRVEFNNNGDNGFGISTDGKVNFEIGEGVTFANEGKGRGWEWRTIEFTLEEETEVKFSVGYTLIKGGSWASVTKPVLLAVAADKEEYDALATAIEANNKIIGFAKGEFAPYANVEAVKALAAANAIDPTENNAKGIVELATKNLTDAKWIANAADTAYIYNSNFATVEPGNNYPQGWTRTNGWGQMLDNADKASTSNGTAYYNQPGSLKYGNTPGYTLPLAAETYYVLNHKYAAWDGNPQTSVVVANATIIEGAEFVVNKNHYQKENAFASATTVFKTDKAADYVIEINNVGNTVITDVELRPATAADIELVASSEVTMANKELPLSFNYPVELAEYEEGETAPVAVVKYTTSGDERPATAVKNDNGYTFTFDEIKDEGDYELIIPAGYFTFNGEMYNVETKFAFEAGSYEKVEAETEITSVPELDKDGKATSDAVLSVDFGNAPTVIGKNDEPVNIVIYGSEFLAEMGANIKTVQGYLAADGKSVAGKSIPSNLTDMNSFEITLPTTGVKGKEFSAVLPAGFFVYLTEDYDWNGAMNTEQPSVRARAIKAASEGKLGQVQEIRVSFTIGDMVTEISSIEMTLDNGQIYTISGQAAKNIVKGHVYIQNGQKFIAK